MNATFSFQRLSGLIRKQWIENNRFYLAASLVLYGLMSLAVIIFWILMNRYRFEETDLYFIYLTSHTEKLVTVFFYHSVLFFLVYSACFLLVKWPWAPVFLLTTWFRLGEKEI